MAMAMANVEKAMAKMTKKIYQRIIWHELACDLTHKKSLNILAVIHSQDLRGIIFSHKMTYKKASKLLGHWYANWYLYGEHHCKGCEICGECDHKVKKPGELCNNCSYKPFFHDAFVKWGHLCGHSCRCITDDIVKIIKELGYDCSSNPNTEYYNDDDDNISWNPAFITKIVRVSDGEVMYPREGVQVGGMGGIDYLYVLPRDIRDAIQYYMPYYRLIIDKHGKHVLK